MLRFRPRTAAPLPTATAVAVAMLVALSAILADAGAVAGASAVLAAARSESTRMPAPLVVSGRALATVLASVAESLEEDWTSGTRRVPSTSTGGLVAPCLGDSLRHDQRSMSQTSLIASGCDDWRPDDGRTATHRRLLNLPPPARA